MPIIWFEKKCNSFERIPKTSSEGETPAQNSLKIETHAPASGFPKLQYDETHDDKSFTQTEPSLSNQIERGW